MGRSQFVLFFLVGATIWYKTGDAATLKQDTITCLNTAFNEELAAGLQKTNQGFSMDNSRVFIQHFKEAAGDGCFVRLSWGRGKSDKSLNARIIKSGSISSGANDPQCLKEPERTCAATLLQSFIPAASLPDPDWTSIGKSWNQLKTAMTEAGNIGADCKVAKFKPTPATPKPNKAVAIGCIQVQAKEAISKFNADAGRAEFSEESEFDVDYTPQKDKTVDFQLRLQKWDDRSSKSGPLFKGSSNPNIPAIPYVYLDDRTCEQLATMRCANQLLQKVPKLLTGGRIGVRKSWEELMTSMQIDKTVVCK